MKRQEGIILLTTTLILSLMMLLLLAQTELIVLHHKAFNRYAKQTDVFQALEDLASRLIKAHPINDQSDCLSKELNPNTVINLLKKQKKGCLISDNKLTYRYLIEYLGQFNCLRHTVNGITHSTRHWRLTVVTLLNSQSFVLQLRFVTLATLTPKPCETILRIPTGILSWRYLT